MQKIYFGVLLLWVSLLGVNGWGQTTYSWRNDQTGSFNWAETTPIFWWRGYAEVPTGNEILAFDGNNGLTSTNDLGNTSRFRIFFSNTGTPSSRTINGSTVNTFFDFSSNQPQIVNNSGVAHTINFPFNNGNNATGNRLEILANSGNLIFGSAIGASGGNRVLVAGGSGQIFFNGVITGLTPNSQTFVREGGGIARFSANNTYNGPTLIDNGELWIESGGDISGGGGIFVGNGGQPAQTAKLWLSNPTGGTTFSRPITINQGNNVAFREIGGLNTSGTNTFSGNITNNSSNGLLVTALNAGGTLNVSGDILGANNPVVFGGNGNINFTGRINYSAGGTVVKNGTGILTASGLSNFTGITTVSAGTFRLGAAGTASPSESPLGTSLNRTEVNNGAVLDLNGFSLAPSEDLTINGTGISSGGALTNSSATVANWIGIITLGSSASIVANNGAINLTNTGSAGGSGAFTLTLGGSTGGSIAHNMLAAGSVGALTKEGSGTWTLSGASTYGGATTISAGTLRIDVSANRIPATTALSIASGATFDLNNLDQQVGSIAGAGAVTLGSGTLTVSTANASNPIFSGNIIGTGGLTKTGTGTNSLTLSGTNTYSGATIISQGDLILNSAAALPNASNVTLSGGRMVLANTIPASAYSLGTLTLDGLANSEIVLGTSTNAATITFASSAAAWASGRRITIRNWSPTGNKNIFVTGSGLTPAQLDVIDFDGYGVGAKFDGTRLIPRFVYITLSSGSGNFSASTSWINGDAPLGTLNCSTNPASIVIQNGFTLTQDANYDFARIENNGTYTAAANTITLCNGANFINNGTVDFSGTATLVCTGTATFSGSAASASFNLNNLTINAATTLTTAPTIRGTLQINAGSSVTASPFYTSTSTLFYNVPSYNRNNEWATGVTAFTSAGYPNNVTIGSSTQACTYNFVNSAALQMGGNLTIGAASGSASNAGMGANTFAVTVLGNVQVNATGTLTLSTESGGDLTTQGNFTNNGTLNTNARALFLTGGANQIIGGANLNALTGNNNRLPFLIVNKATGQVDLGGAINVGQLQMQNNGGSIQLNAFDLVVNTNPIAVTGAAFSASKMIITNSSGRLAFAITGIGNHLYPIGEITGTAEYSPITINIGSSAGDGRTLGMRVVDEASPNLNTPTTASNYLTRYYEPSATGFNSIEYTGSFTYIAGDAEGPAPANLRYSVWYAAPENTWLEYGAGPSSNTLTSTAISLIGSLTNGAQISGREVATKLFYRSITSGNWSDLSTWETSPDASFASPSAALVPPSALNSIGIGIRSTNVVNIIADASLDEAVIEANGTLIKSNAGLTINNGPGVDLEILGTFRHSATTAGLATVVSGSNVVVRTGGVVDIAQNSGGPTFYGTSTNFTYETDAVFNWGISNFFGTSGVIFFPNADVNTIPIFRVSANTSNVGAATPTNINGLFEVNGSITWQNSGEKFFRNGIIGTGTITQNPDCGQFRINGTSSRLGGTTSSLNLNLWNNVNSGLAIQTGTCTLIGNLTANNGPLYIDPPVTFNGQDFSITGSSPLTLNAGATLITANPAGVNGTIALDPDPTMQAGTNYVFNGIGNQTTGNRMAVTIGTLTIDNPSTVTLTYNGHITSTLRLNNGLFQCGLGQNLNIANGGTIIGGGGSQPNDLTSGTITFLGAGSTQPLNGTFPEGTPQLYSVFLNGAVNFRLNDVLSSRILSRLQLNPNGACQNFAPFYEPGSTLVYNNGGIFNRNEEWGQATPLAQGYPHHVVIQNGTTLRMHTNAANYDFGIGGNLTLGNESSAGSLDFQARANRIVINGDVLIGANTSGAPSDLTLGILGSGNNAGDLEIGRNYERTPNGRIFFGAGLGRAIFFTGPTPATITAPTPTIAESFPYVIVDKKGGTGTTLTLASPVNIEEKFTLTSGRVITTEDNILSITKDAPDGPDVGVAVANPDLGVGYVDGPMRRSVINTTGVASYLFPVGSFSGGAHYYKRFRMDTVANASITPIVFIGEYKRSQPPGIATWFFQDNLTGIRANEYWDVNTTSAAAARLILPYNHTDPSGWKSENKSLTTVLSNSNVSIVRGEPAPLEFSDEYNWNYTGKSLIDDPFFSNFGDAPQARAHTISGDISSRLITEFSPFTFGFGMNTILPLRLLSFAATLHGNDAQLHWQLADANDLRHFEVEYSTNGQQFNRLATINDNGGTLYNYRHAGLNAGVHYYRLKMVEKDGLITYSKVEVLMLNANRTLITGLLQNPVVGGQAFVGIYSQKPQYAEAVLYDMAGRALLRQKVGLQTGYNKADISVMLVPKGMYLMHIRSEDGVEKTIRLMK